MMYVFLMLLISAHKIKEWIYYRHFLVEIRQEFLLLAYGFFPSKM